MPPAMPPAGRLPSRAIDPRTGRPTGESYAETSPAQLDDRLETASVAQRTWSGATIAERAEACRSIGRGLLARREELSNLIVAEVGKHSAEAVAEVEKCARLCGYYAERLPGLAEDRPLAIRGAHVRVTHRPLGVVLGIMPWNFPLWQVARFAIPALAAGNAAVLKHASGVPGCAEAFARLLSAELPPGLFASVRLTDADTAALIADPRIAGVSLTGGTRAGRAVGEAAGRALKTSVLELGGSDPYVVLADADLERAADLLVRGRLVNAGQSCIGPKRIVVVDEVRAAFTDLLLARCRRYGYVRPRGRRDAERELAPLARADLREALHGQVVRTIDAGASLLQGGSVPAGTGFFYPVTVLADVPPGSPAATEELFGPVLAILPARGEREAIAIANDSPFGLGAGVFSRDLARAERIAATELRAGAVVVNDYVRTDPRVPFGGIRESGYGRELAEEGYYAFANVKSVTVAHPPRVVTGKRAGGPPTYAPPLPRGDGAT